MKNMTDAELRELHKELEAELERREREEQNRLQAEKDARYKEVIDAYKNFEELRSKYVDDYGQFTLETDSGLFSIRNFLFRG